MKKGKVYITTREIVIPSGTKLNEWHGSYEAVVGITKDSVAYFSMDICDIEYSDGVVAIIGKKARE